MNFVVEIKKNWKKPEEIQEVSSLLNRDWGFEEIVNSWLAPNRGLSFWTAVSDEDTSIPVGVGIVFQQDQQDICFAEISYAELNERYPNVKPIRGVAEGETSTVRYSLDLHTEIAPMKDAIELALSYAYEEGGSAKFEVMDEEEPLDGSFCDLPPEKKVDTIISVEYSYEDTNGSGFFEYLFALPDGHALLRDSVPCVDNE